MMNLTHKDLLEAGVHFGHQLRRYNPKSKEYVFDNRHGISVIDLEITYELLERATDYIEELVADGKEVLFVGTKRQAQEIVREAAVACQMPFCANRWMGGTLTNYETISRSIEKYKRYMAMENDGSLDDLPNKEASAIRREMNRMLRNFEGIVEMKGMPAALFVIDTKAEQIAVAEAVRMNVPVVGLVDTNSDPSLLAYPIPGNDDSTKSVRIIVETVMDAVQNGWARQESRQATPITTFLKENITEEQLPVTSPMSFGETGGNEVPDSYSTDE